jgi:hypothetical protein
MLPLRLDNIALAQVARRTLRDDGNGGDNNGDSRQKMHLPHTRSFGVRVRRETAAKR